MRRILSFLLLAVMVHASSDPLPAAAAPAAQSSVKRDGLVLTITVPIQMGGLLDMAWVFNGDGESYQGQDLADLIAGKIESYWNQGLAPWRYRGCYRIQLEVEIIALARGAAYSGGYHQIDIANKPTVRPSTRAFVHNPGDTDRNTDLNAPYNQSMTGIWGRTRIGTYIHETGHLLGLADDYKIVKNEAGELVSVALPGREGTLMAKGKIIDQALADRIGDLIAEGKDLPGCIYAAAELQLDATAGGDGFLFQGNFESAVQGHLFVEVFMLDDGEGNLKGEGTYTQFITEEYTYTGNGSFCHEVEQEWSDPKSQRFTTFGFRIEPDWISIPIPIQDLVMRERLTQLAGECPHDEYQKISSAYRAPGVIQGQLVDGRYVNEYPAGLSEQGQWRFVIEERDIGE